MSPLDTRHYYEPLAAAFVRGRLNVSADLASHEVIRLGVESGLRLHKFKRNIELLRVRRVLGILRQVAPVSLMDVGLGRGTFLWAMLDAFPHLSA